MTARRPPRTPAAEPATRAAPPVEMGTEEEPAAGVPVPVAAGAEAAGYEPPAPPAGVVPEAGVDLLPAGVVLAGAEVAGPEPPAVAAQAQTLEAAPSTEMADWAPQALSTQFWALAWMAADEAGLHWQAKSVKAQPTAEPAEVRQEVAHDGTSRATEMQPAWALTEAARPRMAAAVAYFIFAVEGGFTERSFG